jgi:hypothetical protein
MSGAPPRHPTVRVLEQLTVGVFIFLWHRTVWWCTAQSGAPLTRCSDFCCALCSTAPLSESTVARWIAIAPLAHRTVRWIIAEYVVFPRVAASDLYEHGAPDTVRWHTGQFGAPDHSTLSSLLRFNLVLNLNLLLVCIEPYAPVIHEFYSKLVSPFVCVGHSTTKINCRKRLTLFHFQSPPFCWLMPTQTKANI